MNKEEIQFRDELFDKIYDAVSDNLADYDEATFSMGDAMLLVQAAYEAGKAAAS
jgi:hypothetical protein